MCDILCLSSLHTVCIIPIWGTELGIVYCAVLSPYDRWRRPFNSSHDCSLAQMMCMRERVRPIQWQWEHCCRGGCRLSGHICVYLCREHGRQEKGVGTCYLAPSTSTLRTSKCQALLQFNLQEIKSVPLTTRYNHSAYTNYGYLLG
jgi:hypothetical protein